MPCPHSQDPDGDGNMNEASGDDNVSKYYAQLLLAVDASHAGENPQYYPYLAMRVEPEELALVEYDGTDVRELGTVAAESAQNAWYTVRASFDGGRVSASRMSATAGEPLVTLDADSTVLNGLGGATAKTGFTVGALAHYQFRDLETSFNTDAIGVRFDWAYDPFGRKVSETVSDGGGSLIAREQFVYDGARVIEERDPSNSYAFESISPWPSHF